MREKLGMKTSVLDRGDGKRNMIYGQVFQIFGTHFIITKILDYIKAK